MSRANRTITHVLIVIGTGLLTYEVIWNFSGHDGGGTSALGAMLIVGGILARR